MDKTSFKGSRFPDFYIVVLDKKAPTLRSALLKVPEGGRALNSLSHSQIASFCMFLFSSFELYSGVEKAAEGQF